MLTIGYAMKTIRSLFYKSLGACLLLLITAPSNSEPIDQATKAYLDGAYPRAFALFQPLAKQGNVSAQYRLANLYADGLGVTADQQKAVYWLRQAADGGYRRAAVDLGNRYASGLGVERSEEKAAEWFRIAGKTAAQESASEEEEEDDEEDCD